MTTVAVQRQAQRRRSPLVGYLLRRAGTSLLLLVGVTIVTFALTNLVPGDPVSAALGEGASQNPATREAFIKANGLDRHCSCSTSSTWGTCSAGTSARRW